MAADEDDWGDDLDLDGTGSLASRIRENQILSGTPSTNTSEPIPGSPRAMKNDPALVAPYVVPLLADFANVRKSFTSSSKVLESLTESISSAYMETLMKKTQIDQQAAMLHVASLGSQLERQKSQGDRYRIHLSRLRKEHGDLLNSLEIATRSGEKPDVLSIPHRSLNTCFTVSLFFLSLVAIFAVVRIIVSSKILL